MSIVDTVAARENEFYAAQTASDLDRLDEIFADDLYFVHTTGAMDNKETYLDGVRRGRYAHGEIWKLHGKIVVADDESGAVSISVVDLTTKAKDLPTLVIRIHQVIEWVNNGGKGWQMKSRQAAKQPL